MTSRQIAKHMEDTESSWEGEIAFQLAVANEQKKGELEVHRIKQEMDALWARIQHLETVNKKNPEIFVDGNTLYV